MTAAPEVGWNYGPVSVSLYVWDRFGDHLGFGTSYRVPKKRG